MKCRVFPLCEGIEVMRKEKISGLLLIFSFYLLAYGLGVFAAYFFQSSIPGLIGQLLIFDLVATVAIWVSSLIIRNSSVYDAYWSLTPMVMLLYLVLINLATLNVFHYLLVGAFLLWSLRLTINWIITFENRHWEDWRYQMFRQNNKRIMWHLINFFGIQMMPTLLVFLGFIPFVYLLSIPLNSLSLIGTIIILTGTLLELYADIYVHRFLRQTTEKKVCEVGLWKYSRHPNYLGEILIWIGVFVSLMVSDLSRWYLGIGMVLMILLFEFISIPMMEKRQLVRRQDYAQYQRTTSRLIPLPKRHLGDEQSQPSESPVD